MAAAMMGSKPAVFTTGGGGGVTLHTCRAPKAAAINRPPASHHRQCRWKRWMGAADGLGRFRFIPMRAAERRKNTAPRNTNPSSADFPSAVSQACGLPGVGNSESLEFADTLKTASRRYPDRSGQVCATSAGRGLGSQNCANSRLERHDGALTTEASYRRGSSWACSLQSATLARHATILTDTRLCPLRALPAVQ